MIQSCRSFQSVPADSSPRFQNVPSSTALISTVMSTSARLAWMTWAAVSRSALFMVDSVSDSPETPASASSAFALSTSRTAMALSVRWPTSPGGTMPCAFGAMPA
jgi:hypothetical protein